MEWVRILAAIATVVATLLVASNWSPRVTVTAFAIFIVSSLMWALDGWMEGKPTVVMQNAALLLINAGGIYRWRPRS